MHDILAETRFYWRRPSSSIHEQNEESMTTLTMSGHPCRHALLAQTKLEVDTLAAAPDLRGLARALHGDISQARAVFFL